MRAILYLATLVTAAALLFTAWDGVSEGDTRAALTEQMRSYSKNAKGKVPPVPELRPLEITPVTVTRDPFQPPGAAVRS